MNRIFWLLPLLFLLYSVCEAPNLALRMGPRLVRERKENQHERL